MFAVIHCLPCRERVGIHNTASSEADLQRLRHQSAAAVRSLQPAAISWFAGSVGAGVGVKIAQGGSAIGPGSCGVNWSYLVQTSRLETATGVK